jgi:hypothetical protein
MFFNAAKRIDDKQEVGDGESVKRSLVMMDGKGPSLEDQARYAGLAAKAGHKPGFIPWSDAEIKMIEAIRAAYNDRLIAAWHDPEPVLAQGMPERHDAPVTDTSVSAAYARRDRELSERWRNPG